MTHMKAFYQSTCFEEEHLLLLPPAADWPAAYVSVCKQTPFSSSAAEKVPILQFKGPTGPASMIDSLEMRTRV